MIDKIDIENGKYSIVLEDDYQVNIYRHGELSVENPPHSKMMISIIYELQELRKLVSDISFDFDPEERLGPPCGSEMLKRIKEYEERFNVDLRYAGMEKYLEENK